MSKVSLKSKLFKQSFPPGQEVGGGPRGAAGHVAQLADAAAGSSGEAS